MLIQRFCTDKSLLENCNYALGKILFILAKQTNDPTLLDEYLSNMRICFINSNMDQKPDHVDAAISQIIGLVLIEKNPDNHVAKQHLRTAYEFYQGHNMEDRMRKITALFPGVIDFEPNTKNKSLV